MKAFMTKVFDVEAYADTLIFQLWAFKNKMLRRRLPGHPPIAKIKSLIY